MSENLLKVGEQGLNALEAHLLKKRTVLLFGEIDATAAAKAIASILYLEDEDAVEPIKLYVNSTGGCETEVLAIYDIMRTVRCPIETLCVGKAHGLAAILLAGGEKGLRKAYANSEIMLTQVGRERTFGQASDIELETDHLLESKKRITALLALLCNKNEADVYGDLERKFFLFAEGAKEYGIIDEII